MTILNKGLTRPATPLGVPIVPLVLVSFTIILLGIYTHFYWLILLIIPAIIEMRSKARKDVHFFSLKILALKMRGNRTANKHYGSTAITSGQYSNVDIEEFNKNMRLNQCANISKYIPYSSHIHQHVVKNKSGDFVSTWELGGTLFECEDAEYIESMATQLNNIVRSYEGMPFTFYIHRIREEFYDSMECTSGIPFSDEITALFYGAKKKPFRCTRLFFTACFIPLTKIERATAQHKTLSSKKAQLNESLKVMMEHWESINTSLARFSAAPTGAYEEEGRVYSSQLSFYNRLITGFWQKVAITSTPFYDVLGNADLFFSTDTGQVNTTDRQMFFRGIEIKDYASKTYAGLFDALLYAETSYVLTQSFTCMGRDEAKNHIKLTQNRLKSSEDDAVSQQEDLQVARDMLQSGHISFGKYHFSLVVSSPCADQVVKDTNALTEPLKDLGILVTLSSLSLPAAYLSQLPGIYGLRPRLVTVSSQNYAEMASLHNFSSHKRTGNPWGEAIAVLDTPSGGNYYLNLHNSQLGVDDFNEKHPGNTIVIGSTGTGKSTLLTVIKHLMQKYRRPDSFEQSATKKRLTTVYFDKDRSAEMSIRLMGGSYFRIRSGEPTGWNPFAMKSTKRNLNFIKQLMRMICTRDGKPLDPRDEERISDAVNKIMALPLERRSFGITRMLEILPEPNTAEARTNGLRIRLKQWAGKGEFAWVFDNEFDTFDIDEIDNFGIDGTEFLDDKDVRGPITAYLMYRVTSLLDGRRLVLFMDEFWKWLQDKEFSKFALNMLKVIRKLNGIFVPATQSPEEMVKHEISAAIIEQCGTQIFMANPKSSAADYVDRLKVPESVFHIIKNLDPGARKMVVLKTPLRRGDVKPFISIVSLNLSGLGRYTKLLSGSEDNMKIFDGIYKEGMRPNEWKSEMLHKAI